MEQICNFDTLPKAIVDGGYKKGRWIVWLNLSVSEKSDMPDSSTAKYQALTDRLTLSNSSIQSFLESVSPGHLACATNEELNAILSYFKSEDDIESWKALRKIQIQGYDSSNKVNMFYLNGVTLWLDKATRVGLVNSVTMEKNAGRENTDLWFGSTHIEMPVDTALKALTQLELYAKDCYNITARHLATIESCESIDELKAYNIASDYPEMLQLKIDE